MAAELGYSAATISLDRKPEQNLVLINGEYVNKPANLYAWTVQSSSSSTASQAGLLETLYFSVPNPTTAELSNIKVYNSSGTDVTSSYVYGAADFREIDGSTLKWSSYEPI